MTASIGFVGLGAMGGAMVKRLLRAGRRVRGYNRTREKGAPLAALGMEVAESPREAAQASEVVFTMVTNAQALHAVTEGPDGVLAGLGRGKVFVEMSTVAPEVLRALAPGVLERGAQIVDAPVSGSPLTVDEGKATFMVGGDAAAFEAVKPVLLDIGPRATHVGPLGSAKVMKIATNLSLAVQMLAFSEGVLLAEKSGIAREVACEVLLNSVIASPMLKYRAPFVLRMPREAWFDCGMMQKDLVFALDLGRELRVTMPATALANELLNACRAMGLGDHDFAVLFHALARMAGVDAPVALEPAQGEGRG